MTADTTYSHGFFDIHSENKNLISITILNKTC